LRYAIDCEFIDTPQGSALISLGLVREDGEGRYWEFNFPHEWITPWLAENVIPHMDGGWVEPQEAAREICEFIGNDKPEFWCYFGAYDWYWFCRLFGGLFNIPDGWPHRYRELADFVSGKPVAEGVQHNALADARGIMATLKAISQ
jgi:hypothetical protein